MEGKTNRLFALEGLRGIAAIVVVVFHLCLIFYPAFFYGVGMYVPSLHHFHFEDNIFGNPLSVFMSGAFAVTVFFVISGFVLSIGFFRTHDQMVIRKLAAKRYIRLMLPVLASIGIVWIILSLGLDNPKEVTETMTHSQWLASIWNLVPNLGDALSQGVWGVFSIGDVSYNPVLWTMKYELIGSFLIFGISLLFKQSKHRWIIYILLIAGTYNSYYLGFVLGMLLADLYSEGRFPFTETRKPTMIGVFLIGLLMGGYPVVSSMGTFYASMRINWLTEAQNESFYLSLGAAFVVAGILTIPRLSRLFGSKLISKLGKYTFSLYLVHMAVIFTITTSLFVWLHGFLGYNKAALLAAIMSLPFIAIVAYWFERYVDAPSIRLSGIFSNWLLGLPQSEGVSAYADRTNANWLQKLFILLRLRFHRVIDGHKQ